MPPTTARTEADRGSHAISRALRPHRRPCVVTIGTFDGVHPGHRLLVSTARAAARVRNVALTAVTFAPRPDKVLAPARALPDLCTLTERIARLRLAGADDVVVLPFDRAVADVMAERFVEHLIDDLGMRTMCVGEDFALGRDREGDVAAIRRLGIEVVVPETLCGSDGRKVSSSAVRAAVARATAGR